MRYVIYKEDTKTHSEVFVINRKNGQLAITAYAGAAKPFPSARAAYEWAAQGDATLQYWKVRRI